MNRRNLQFGRLAALLTVCASALVAQGTQTASATITVTDAAGKTLSGVAIRMTSPSLQGARTGMTDENGRFAARLLPPGAYLVELTKEGFQTAKLTSQIGIDQNFQPRVLMQKTSSTVVEVVATASPDVDKTDVKSAINYNMDRIDKLPNGRTMEAVALLTPGVTSGVGGRVQIRGAMTSGNLYLVDGQNIADNAYNNRGVLLIDDAIEETQIITGAISAEYGNVEGGVLNAITKSGGNTFSGMIRWDLTNSQWNATQPLTTSTGRNAIPNILNTFKTFTLGGPILKDRLWFFGAYYRTSQSNVGNIASGSLPTSTDPNLNEGAGAAFVFSQEEIRRSFKLTYSINQDHTLVAAFGNSQNAQVNRNYSAGELKALVPQKNTSEYGNLAWRATWSPTFLTDVRYGYKKQLLSAGATNAAVSPIYSYNTRLFYNNGIFNSNDGGDNRDNKTLNAKGTLFFDAAGNHQLDFGLDYIKGESQARNEQTVTGYIFGVLNLNMITRVARPLDVWTYQSAVGKASNTNTGIFVNDKWVVNKNMALQLGIRFDKYEAKNEKGSKTAGATGFSPRLGLKYDLNADGKWVLGVSAARYNGKVLDAIANSVTNQGNPTEIDHPYAGPSGLQPFSVIYDLNNYDYSEVSYYNNPALNVKLNSALKAPNVDELQLNGTYSFSHKTFGEGFINVTAVSKKWNNLIDFRIGNDGTVQDPAQGNDFYIKVWDNSSIAERKYSSLELRVNQSKGPWAMDGNITWSKLEGNYEGEGTNTPGRGEGLQNFTTFNGVATYDRSIVAPYGFLAGHVPIRARWQGAYTKESSFGRSTVGLIYRFDSGNHYSDTRALANSEQLYPGLPGDFGSTVTQFRDNKRGAYVFNSASYLDLSLHHDWTMFSVRNVPVHAFAKLVVTNVLNHTQILTWNTTSNGVPEFESDGVTEIVYPTATTRPWVRGASYGKQTSPGNYGAVRGVTISLGVTF
ncbi:MAG: carboxypeptidase regulatory-like domain-containing protein [Holophagaceae bacterium]|nr:carboxypeptidase regulatory-like domain-containing protein [Holophagaceae bacterium]